MTPQPRRLLLPRRNSDAWRRRKKLMAHDESHLFREAMRQFDQALATNCLATTRLKERVAAEDEQAQEISRLHKEVERL